MIWPYAAVSVGLETATILSVLGRLSKTQLSPEIHSFVEVGPGDYILPLVSFATF